MLTHQKASEIKAGDQLLYKFRRYQVTEVLVLDHCVRLVGVGQHGALYVVLSAHRKLWTLRKREHHDPLHGLRGRQLPVRRRPELPGLLGDRHLPVLSRDHVVGEVAQRETLVGPGVLAIRTLVGSRVRAPRFGEVPQVPYVLSVAGSPLVPALHAGRRPGFGAEGGREALGERSMVPDLCASLPHTRGSAVGRDWSAGRTIRIVIPSGLQERDDQGIQAR
jgi:hypothetical protein